jgi:molecular chaperone DnaK
LNKAIERMVTMPASMSRKIASAETADACNPESLVYQTRRLHDLALPSGDRQNIEARITALHESVKGDDIAGIRRQHDDLQNAFHALSQQLYAQQPQPGTQSGAPNNGGNGRNAGHEDGEVVDGEFREA